MIYLDHAATTRPDARVVDAMLPFLKENYLNPSAIYQPALYVRNCIEEVRGEVADFLRVRAEQIFFTGGGTESDNWAIRMGAETRKDRGRHIIASPVEHPAVMNSLRALEQEGYEITYLPVDRSGRVSASDAEQAIREDTILITCMHVNNELGCIEPIEEIGELAKAHHILFHTDAVQSFGHLPIDLSEGGIDLLSASAHKVYGPKGCGILYVREPHRFGKLLYGGKQENGMRPGTENVPAIIGFGEAVRLASARLQSDLDRLTGLRESFKERLLSEVPDVIFHESAADVYPGILNVAFPEVSSETLLIILDQHGICASAGSACAAGAIEVSPVLAACGIPKEEAMHSIRFSLGRDNTEEELKDTAEIIGSYIRSKKLRKS